MKKRMTKLNNRSIENIQIEVEEKLKTETRDRTMAGNSLRYRSSKAIQAGEATRRTVLAGLHT